MYKSNKIQALSKTDCTIVILSFCKNDFRVNTWTNKVYNLYRPSHNHVILWKWYYGLGHNQLYNTSVMPVQCQLQNKQTQRDKTNTNISCSSHLRKWESNT